VKKPLLFASIITLLVGFQMLTGRASSHREAPLISQDPMADNTDLYAFRSPDRPDTVTIIANYIPLESPAGGPNFPAFDDTVLYEINVDNNGDAREDLSYQFRFHTDTRNPETFCTTRVRSRRSMIRTGIVRKPTRLRWLSVARATPNGRPCWAPISRRHPTTSVPGPHPITTGSRRRL